MDVLQAAPVGARMHGISRDEIGRHVVLVLHEAVRRSSRDVLAGVVVDRQLEDRAADPGRDLVGGRADLERAQGGSRWPRATGQGDLAVIRATGVLVLDGAGEIWGNRVDETGGVEQTPMMRIRQFSVGKLGGAASVPLKVRTWGR